MLIGIRLQVGHPAETINSMCAVVLGIARLEARAPKNWVAVVLEPFSHGYSWYAMPASSGPSTWASVVISVGLHAHEFWRPMYLSAGNRLEMAAM